MTDIRDVFANMTNGSQTDSKAEDEAAPVASKPAKKKPTIEKTYQKKSQLEHILLRPDTYIGSVEKLMDTMWVYNLQTEKMEQKEIEYVPGLYKIFDEILVNAADNKQRDKNMDCIKIEIRQEENVISIWNNGKGIPVVMHKDENMYVPTMIFGHLLTSSNYNDEEEKVTGGRNGYGAKLCNIFSTKFVVETSSKDYKSQFKQTWGSNMSKASEPKVRPSCEEDYTKITFSPDLSKFKMDKLDDDIVMLMSRRAFDVAASTRGVKVFLNGKRLGVKSFKDYIDLYIKGKEDEQGNPLKVAYEQVNDRWEVAITISDKGFQQVSFVNSIATTKGGRHVDYIADMVTKQLIEVIKKKNKGGVVIKPFQVKNHMWIFINCLIVNPTFDSQTKETMTLQAKNFGSKCTLPEKFITQVMKSGIIESVLSWAKYKAQKELAKTSGRKQTKLKGIPKLEDANEAGSKNALKCTLILTEGDSAKSTVMSGLGVVGRDYYGIFPLRGKMLNVREASHKQILENQEINNIIQILGLQYKKKYNTPEDMKTLRYGKLMIMTDQDHDGSHIKGLLINFIHHNWPELLKQNFLEQFITPIVKARKNKECISFYSIPEYEEWRANTPNYNTYTIKYYKGLGTSDAREGREYFSNMDRHRIKFRYTGQQDDDHILLAFSKKNVDLRKEWLTNYMVESRRRKEIGLAEKYLYGKDTKYISFTDFINMELVLFSNGDNIRSIPSMVDGLKPGQRKILFVALKRNDKREIKVAQLVGSVIEKAAYHHGDTSLAGTIVGLAQNFVGSNNINLLEPRGQFGTRLTGGKDAASPRYIFTKLSPLTRHLFHVQDDPLLKPEFDDNIKIEPQWYIPIIPMVLVNGADGIGTGWMTKIPNFNPREIVKNLRRLLDGEEPEELNPWYKNFKGTIESCGDGRYVCHGEMGIIDNEKIEISELPVHTWTSNYKENVLEPMVHGNDKIKPTLTDYKDYSTDLTVKYVISLPAANLQTFQKEGLHKSFRLQTLISLGSMCAFDEYGCLKKYDSVMSILQDFYVLRLKMYEKRKDYLIGMLESESQKLSAQAKFIMEKCNGELVVENKKRKTIVDELIKKGYPADPVAEWKAKMKSEDEEEAQTEEVEADETADEASKKKKKESDKVHPDVKKYDYLLGMSMWMLTDERKNELLKQKDDKLMELNNLSKKSPSDLWRSDLDVFLEELDKYEKKERQAMEAEMAQRLKTQPGKKKAKLNETLPTESAKRIEPVITEELNKKIQNLVKSKKNAENKKIKKENIADQMVEDEFDLMVKNKKSLKEKIGTPEEATKKGRAKKEKSDGMKQTKLNFAKVNGSPKKKGRGKKKSSDSELESDASSSDIEFVSSTKERAKRNVTKPIKYNISDDEDEKISDKEDELFDNEAIKETSIQREILETSEDEVQTKPPPRHETSEDMFDSLVGRKKDDDSREEKQSLSPITTFKRKNSFSDSDPDFSVVVPATDDGNKDFDQLNSDKFSGDDAPKKSKAKPKPKADGPKKPRAKKKKSDESSGSKKTAKSKIFSSDEDDPLPPKKKPRKKKNASSDEDFDLKSKITHDSDDDSVASIGANSPKATKRPPRAGRGAAAAKNYAESDNDSF